MICMIRHGLLSVPSRVIHASVSSAPVLSFMPFMQPAPCGLFTKINAGRTHVPGRPAHGDRLLRASELWRGNHGSPPCALCALPEALTRSLPRAFCDAGRTLANRLTAPQRNATRRDCQPSKPFVDGCATNRGTGEVAMRACGSAGKAAHMMQFRKTVRASNP